jgi:type VI secretion system protein ImpA
MPSIDFEILTRPISEAEPCGSDLDAAGDMEFLNFFASAESALPQSYFRAREASGGELRLFDPKMLPFDQYFENAKRFLTRTRDIRLTVLLAKFSILNRDLDGFVICLKALATLLTGHWNEVHPRGEGGDFSYRAIALEALDVTPTVTMPLQFLPVLQDRRHGPLSYRNHLTATGAASSAEGEPTLDSATIDRILDSGDLDRLVEVHGKLNEILGAVRQICTVWIEKSESDHALNFSQLTNDVDAVVAWLGVAIQRRSSSLDPGATDLATNSVGVPSLDTAAQRWPAAAIRSAAAASTALAAVALYYATHEPSSPARLLIHKSEQMVGKSFAEIVRSLVPAHVEQAVIQFGRDGLLDLPIEQMAATLPGAGAPPIDEAIEVTEVVTSRAQALAIIDQISVYFRSAEPSSPIPVLLDRVRDLGQRDFLSLLRSVLPSDALKSSDG